MAEIGQSYNIGPDGASIGFRKGSSGRFSDPHLLAAFNPAAKALVPRLLPVLGSGIPELIIAKAWEKR